MSDDQKRAPLVVSLDTSEIEALSQEEIDWCDQFSHATQLKMLLAITPLSNIAQDFTSEDPRWIEKALLNRPKGEAPVSRLWVLGLGKGHNPLLEADSDNRSDYITNKSSESGSSSPHNPWKWLESVHLWLERDSERFFVVIEPNLSFLRAFLRHSTGLHPRLALIYLESDPFQSESPMAQLFAKWMADGVSASTLHPHYQEQTELWQQLQKLVERAALWIRHHLQAPDRMAYALRNAWAMQEAQSVSDLGEWIDLPVVLAGAGPSLTPQLEGLRTWRSHLLLISCGTASQILQKAKIEPDWVAGVCSFPEHFQRFRRTDFIETPALVALHMDPGVMRAMSSQKVLLKNFGGHAHSLYLEQIMGNNPSIANESVDFDHGPSVLTSALRAVVEMGATRLILVGSDLSYAHESKYAAGADRVESATPGGCLALNGLDQIVESEPVWLRERAWIEQFLQKHPKIELRLLSRTGLTISGSIYSTLEQALESSQATMRDTASLSWHAYQIGEMSSESIKGIQPFDFVKKRAAKKGDIDRLLSTTQASLQRAFDLSKNSYYQLEKHRLESSYEWAHEVLDHYIQTLSQEPTYEAYLKGLDSTISASQQRHWWRLARCYNKSEVAAERWVGYTLIAQRIIQMSQRLKQLLVAVESSALENSIEERAGPIDQAKL